MRSRYVETCYGIVIDVRRQMEIRHRQAMLGNSRPFRDIDPLTDQPPNVVWYGDNDGLHSGKHCLRCDLARR